MTSVAYRFFSRGTRGRAFASHPPTRTGTVTAPDSGSSNVAVTRVPGHSAKGPGAGIPTVVVGGHQNPLISFWHPPGTDGAVAKLTR